MEMKVLLIKVLLSIILYFESIHGLELGKLTIGKSGDQNEIDLKSNNLLRVNASLKATFFKTSVLSAESKGSKTAEIYFNRDKTAQNTRAFAEEELNDNKIAHYSINWINPNSTEEFCIHLDGNQHWFSTYEEKTQRWPLDKSVHFNAVAFATNDFFQNQIGSIVENLWLGSDGFAVFVERSNPLFLSRDTSSNKTLLCFSADYQKSPYNHAIDTKETKLNVHLISGNDIKHVYQYAAKLWIKKPIGIPDERMFKFPVWSTWAKMKDNVTQTKVLDYAKEINHYGLPDSQIEIDETWEIHYGEHKFDTKKFPNVKDMVKQLHGLGFRVTLWNTPFVNPNCDNYKTDSKYLVKNKLNEVVTHKWWNGLGAHVDFSDSEARKWFVNRLEMLRNETGIDSFKFDAGEVGWINPDFQFSDRLIQQTPGVITQLYVETAAQLGKLIEVRSGYNSQHLPIFVRMLDKDSKWGYDNGLKTMIPTALMMSIAGYAFVLPDMIGGNAYGNFPSKELYIRWLQVNTFMPALQFSINPWDFGQSSEEVINITKQMLKIHEQYTPLLIELAKNATITGEPILRPVWWVAPNDEKTYAIDDQFLVGNDLLVAPITTEGSRKRNIYLPSGQWKDQKGIEHKGGQTLVDFSVGLEELPYFIRK